MDKTFFLFLALFGIIIVYLFHQKNEQEKQKNNMKEQLESFVNQNDFMEGGDETGDDADAVGVNNTVTNFNGLPQEEPATVAPEPSNAPDTPVTNGYSTSLVFNHPDKINGCDIINLAPLDYYSKINQKIEDQYRNQEINEEVSGYNDDENYYKLE